MDSHEEFLNLLERAHKQEIERKKASTSKYDKDGSFQDPVLRCDSCAKLVFMEDIRILGMCPCGNRKVRNLQTFTNEELEVMQKRNVDPEFIALFQDSGVANV